MFCHFFQKQGINNWDVGLIVFPLLFQTTTSRRPVNSDAKLHQECSAMNYCHTTLAGHEEALQTVHAAKLTVEDFNQTKLV